MKTITLSRSRQTRDPYPRSARIERIKRIVADTFHTDPASLTARARVKNIANAKRIAIGITREVLGAQNPELMRAFNLKDISAVTHSIRRLQERCEKNIGTATTYEALYRTCLKAAGYPNVTF